MTLHLDGIDRKLLRLVQDDSRRSVQEMGEAAGLSASACHRRVKALEDSGAIAGYRAVLDAGQLGRLDRDGRTQVTRGIDPSLYLAWTKGRLVFHDAMLRDVATQLERWFDVEIRISDPALATRRVTATVTVQSLDDVLAAVTFPLGIRYTRTGHVIELAGAPRGR